MPDTSTKDLLRLLVPVRRINNRYRIEGSGDVTEPVMQARLRSLVERRYQVSTECVEACGRLFTTDVYTSDDRMQGYVEVNPDGLPIDSKRRQDHVPRDLLRRYLHRLIARLSKSDGITPDTATPLDSWFVEPNASWVGEPNTGSAPWSEVRGQTRLVLLGGPGAGKTSCLRRIALDWAQESLNSDDPSIPVYVQLRDLPFGHQDVPEIEAAASWRKDEDLRQLLVDHDSLGRVVLILDGLDEVPSVDWRDQIQDYILSLCVAVPTIRVVVSTRESTYRSVLSDFAHVRMDPFDDAKISHWSFRYVLNHRPRADWAAFLGHLQNVPDIADLASNPLLLSLIASMYVRDRIPPENTALVLERCIDALLHDWDAARGVLRWPESPSMYRQMRLALADLSFTAASDDREEFFLDDLQSRSERFVGFRSSPLVILNACTVAGVVDEREPGHWTFAHRTFQEFLAARFLIDSTENINGYFAEAGNERRGRIWEISCGLASDATDLLRGKADADAKELLTSASLLAGALRQDITATRAAISSCCAVIRQALEANSDFIVQVDARDLSRSDVASEDATWTVALCSESEATNAILSGLLNGIHQARLGTAVDFLWKALSGSRHSVVRHVAESMRTEGRYDAIDAESIGYGVLVVIRQPAQGLLVSVLDLNAADGEDPAQPRV